MATADCCGKGIPQPRSETGIPFIHKLCNVKVQFIYIIFVSVHPGRIPRTCSPEPLVRDLFFTTYRAVCRFSLFIVCMRLSGELRTDAVVCFGIGPAWLSLVLGWLELEIASVRAEAPQERHGVCGCN